MGCLASVPVSVEARPLHRMQDAPPSPPQQLPPLDLLPAGYDEAAEGKPRVAVVGGGYLGSRIAAELGLCGCDVSIFDRTAGPDAKQGVERALLEVEQAGLIDSEGAVGALGWVHVGLSLAECVRGRNLIVEAVPDDAALKGKVFSEVTQHCAARQWSARRAPKHTRAAGNKSGRRCVLSWLVVASQNAKLEVKYQLTGRASYGSP